jgi:hypothetical protein
MTIPRSSQTVTKRSSLSSGSRSTAWKTISESGRGSESPCRAGMLIDELDTSLRVADCPGGSGRVARALTLARSPRGHSRRDAHHHREWIEGWRVGARKGLLCRRRGSSSTTISCFETSASRGGLKNHDVLGPVVTEHVQLGSHVLACVVALAPEIDPSVTRLVPTHAPVLRNRALHVIKQFVGALTGQTPLQIDDSHGNT